MFLVIYVRGTTSLPKNLEIFGGGGGKVKDPLPSVQNTNHSTTTVVAASIGQFYRPYPYIPPIRTNPGSLTVTYTQTYRLLAPLAVHCSVIAQYTRSQPIIVAGTLSVKFWVSSVIEYRLWVNFLPRRWQSRDDFSPLMFHSYVQLGNY